MKTFKSLGVLLVAMLLLSWSGLCAPDVVVTSPTNNATYTAPATILLRAESSDTNGIAFTQIRVGTNWMGSAKTNFFAMTWSNVPPGNYTILADTMNNLDVRATSAPVNITVVSNTLPFVSVIASDSHAAEPGVDTGELRFSRSGNLATNLTIFFSVTGTASNGVDYTTIPTSIVIPAGASNGTITIQPLDDTLLEQGETIAITLKSNSFYRLLSSTATVYLYDDETNHAPTVGIISPVAEEIFSNQTSLLLTAEASDIDGHTPIVTFYRNGTLIGTGVKDATNNTFSTTWTNVPAGTFTLTARARDGINEGINTTSAPVNITVTRSNPTPYVYISSPNNGRIFTNIVTMGLSAYAYSGATETHIEQVEFYFGTNLLVTLTNSSSANFYYLQWSNPPAGNYVFTARAVDSAGFSIFSSPVNFSILALPTITVTAADAIASEPGTDTGLFRVSRTGDVSSPLLVSYGITGTAVANYDYAALPGTITIAAGSNSATVLVQPINDTVIESTETVVLTVKATNNPATYLLGPPFSATVSIMDNDSNSAPTVSLFSPTNGSSFTVPTNVLLQAEAHDIDGTISGVAFFRGTNHIGTAYATNAGTTSLFGFLWTNPPTGDFTLTARAYDNYQKASTSAPVSISIIEPVISNSPPSVSILSPTEGTIFQSSSNIQVAAEATDSNGYVQQVEFISNGTSLGVVTNDSSSGQSGNLFVLTLFSPAPGTYELSAIATDNEGLSVTSAPVHFEIVPKATVTVSSPDTSASEGGTNTGIFRISRTGSTALSLVVNYSMSGVASNGVDYNFLVGRVYIPAGESNATIVVEPIDDALLETTETVNLALRDGSGYVIGYPTSASVFISDNETNQAATVVMLSPTNEARFTVPTNIFLQAEAHDSDGSVASVYFYRGTNQIGKAASSNATQTVFGCLWTNPIPGDFLITARAFDNFQKASTSAPVHIVITTNAPSNAAPSVSIYTPTNGASYNAPTNIQVAAQASDSDGTVSTVQFFANGLSLGIVTNYPFATIVDPFHVTWANPSPGDYELFAKAIDDRGAAKTSSVVHVTIHAPAPSNTPPTISILSPTNNTVVYGSTNLLLMANAADADGQIARVEFFTGDRLLGACSNAPYQIVWSNVAPATYKVSAKAVDNWGTVAWAIPVNLTVKSITEFSFVSRTLPPLYVPGVKLNVRLQASPRTNTTLYFVQEFPPVGWTINTVGENGSIDTGGQSVTFGPFNDRLTRTLAYTVTPPAGESGEKHFAGYGTANDITSPVLGMKAINAAPPHPADLSPTNFFISTNELSAYVLAWKRCDKWPISPSPVPLNYLTRAGYIMQGGGTYAISTNYPSALPPMIWVRDPLIMDATASTLSNGIPWTTASNYGSAVSSIPTNYFSNVSFTVSLVITPPASCSAQAIEDRPPEGWTVTNVSDGGFYCPILRKVKWGLFLDNQKRTLTYQITPGTNLVAIASFSGVASFDGINVPISGKRTTTFNQGTVPPARLQAIMTSTAGDRIISFLGQPGVVYRLEGSTDLSDWAVMDELLNDDGVLYYTDPATTNFVHRFYRAIPVEGN